MKTRKSNFLNSSFSPGRVLVLSHFQGKSKKVTNYILLVLTCMFILSNNINVHASNIEEVKEVSASVPESIDKMNTTLTSIDMRLSSMEKIQAKGIQEFTEINENLEVLTGVTARIFGGIFLVFVCICFIAFYRLFNTFFRF